MELNEHIRLSVLGLRDMAARNGIADRPFHDQIADADLVRFAMRGMMEKLASAWVKGRGGWWNQDECSVDALRKMLRSHVEKGDMRDVLNLAAMIYVREIADAPEPADKRGAAL